MNIVKDKSPKEFLDHCADLLYRDEPTNSLMLGLSENLTKLQTPIDDLPIMIRFVDKDGKTLTAALQTPKMNLVLTYAEPNQLESIAHYLFENKVSFPGVVGPAKECSEFCEIWSALNGLKIQLGMNQKIYKIESVRMPFVNGEFRLAEKRESEIVAKWLFDFSAESLPPPEQRTLADRKTQAEKAIEKELAYLWLVAGEPVAMTHIGRPTKNGISVSAVYTPPNFRKNGYASALVAAVSQQMLDSGKRFCVLYTDTANPTSNKIYQNIGYLEVSDSKHCLFSEILK